MQPLQIISLSSICPIIGTIPHTIAGWVWTGVTMLGPLYSLLIILGLVVWVVIEFATRNGTLHYNSDNGFSPPFNVFVGSCLNFTLQELLGLLLSWIFGDGTYCVPWPYILHFFVYMCTGLFLRWIGFWTYLRILGESPQRRNVNPQKVSQCKSR